MCGKGKLRGVSGDYETRLTESRSGRERKITVRDVTWEECVDCGEVFLDEDATRKVESARLAAMRRLSPDSIKAFRNKLRKTQTEMAELLGLGEKTYARWESGAYIQNAAFDRYLRLAMASGSNVEILHALAQAEGEPPADPAASPRMQQFPLVAESEALVETAHSFTEMLTSGTAFLPMLQLNSEGRHVRNNLLLI
jgi:putative zinc finger/helix-turn-helix YgiT family protein